MRKIGRRAFSAGMATLAACGGRTATEPQDAGALPPPDAGGIPGPEAQLPTPFPEAPGPTCAFPSFTVPGVTDVNFSRQTLYSWTTKEQVAALRRDKVLYTKTANDKGQPGYLFEVLKEAELHKDPTIAAAATLLGSEPFRLGRYAWPFPWATQITSAVEDYGNQLIRIDLKPDSFLVFADEVWRGQAVRPVIAMDMVGRKVDWALVQQTPERIAGVYFLSRGGDAALGPGCQGSFGPGLQYREFHLCHESTVASWSIGTKENLARIEDDITMLGRLIAAGPLTSCADWPCFDVASAWAGAPWKFERGSAPQDLYTFLTNLHLAPFDLNRLRDDLVQAKKRLEAARFSPDPLVHVPGT